MTGIYQHSFLVEPRVQWIILKHLQLLSKGIVKLVQRSFFLVGANCAGMACASVL